MDTQEALELQREIPRLGEEAAFTEMAAREWPREIPRWTGAALAVACRLFCDGEVIG